MKPSVAVAVLSFKGGVGKSTITACVAYAIKKASALRPIVIDAAEDATATSLLAPQCYVRGGTLTYVTGGGALEICTAAEDGAKVDVIPPSAPSGAAVQSRKLSELVEALRGEYNIIFIDLPGTSELHSPLIAEALKIADAYIFVLTPQTVHMLDRFRKLIASGKPYVVIINRYVEGYPGKHEALALGSTRWGQAGFVIEDEPEVEVMTVRRQLPCEAKTKFHDVIDKIAMFVIRAFFS